MYAAGLSISDFLIRDRGFWDTIEIRHIKKCEDTNAVA